MSPPGWLRYLEPSLSYDDLREALRPLLELPVEMVLVSHGQPVLRGGRTAIERALS
jgi:AAA+ ATPase superfamily predicted ATPase